MFLSISKENVNVWDMLRSITNPSVTVIFWDGRLTVWAKTMVNWQKIGPTAQIYDRIKSQYSLIETIQCAYSRVGFVI